MSLTRQKRMMRTILALIGLCIMAAASMNVFAADARWNNTTSRDANNNILITFQDLTVTLPDDWSGKVQMNISDTGVAFYQIASREKWTEALGYANGGRLFGISYATDDSYLDLPNYTVLGTVDGGTYYLTQPTDVQAYTDDADIFNEYTALNNDMVWVISNIQITAASSSGTDDSYIFPQSSTEYLSESDLEGMSASEIQMAINEIYARHHRKFVLQDVQDYFNSKSWYTGTIEASDFDPSVMNTIEGTNIDLMVKYMNSLTSSDGTAETEGSSTANAYGMIIESGDGYFRVQVSDGSIIQFWYENDTLTSQGITADALTVGATVSLVYDTSSYEALSILVW